MFRATLLIVFAIIITFAALAIGQQGRIVVELGGYVVEMKPIFAIMAFAAMLPLIWFVGLLIEAPGRVGGMAAQAKTRRGQEALARGLIAAEAGEYEDARRHAATAVELIEEPRLVALLEARAAESAGDRTETERAYTQMLTHEDTELLGRKGLMQCALVREDRAAAASHAGEAMKLAKDAEWPFQSLFQLRVQGFEWDAALDALDEGEKRKFVDAKVADRRRAVLLSAAAARLERELRPDRAIDCAEKALRLAPGFAPAAVMAARLLAEDSKLWKAQSILEETWEAAPHPAVAHAYRDLKADEIRADRARRMAGLVELQPEHRESRILSAELAMERGDWAAAQEALDAAFRDLPSSRICALYAALSRARNDEPNARQWLAQAAVAPREAEWTDLDPDGPAFVYSDEDWARLVYVFGDAGNLIHPRLERGGRDAGAGSVLALPPSQRVVAEAQVTPINPGSNATRAAG